MTIIKQLSRQIQASTQFDQAFPIGKLVLIQVMPAGPIRITRVASRSFLGAGLEVFIAGRRTSIPCAWVHPVLESRQST